MNYTIEFEGGGSVTVPSLDEAERVILTRYPEAVIGHDGDLTERGDRTLCWASEDDSINDDGRRACATIRAARTKAED